MLDTTLRVETPEGVEIGLRLAGPPVRLLAWGIDVAIRLAIYTVAAIPLSILEEAGFGLFLLLVFFGEWLYPVLFEGRAGATPGKLALGLLVLHDDGTPVGWSGAVVRNLLRFADFLPLAYGFGLVSMLVHRQFKRLGDLAAGTVVVYRPPVGLSLVLTEASPLPPAVPLSPDEQQAIIDYAARLSGWTPARARELAEIARPLTGASGSEGVRRLLGIANWLLGRR